MSIDRFIFRFAGTIVLGSSLLAYFHHKNWLWISVFVGANMLQSSITGFCPLASILKRIGFKSTQAF